MRRRSIRIICIRPAPVPRKVYKTIFDENYQNILQSVDSRYGPVLGCLKSRLHSDIHYSQTIGQAIYPATNAWPTIGPVLYLHVAHYSPYNKMVREINKRPE